MIAFVEGPIVEKNPLYVVIQCGAIGYQVIISLNTYSQIERFERVKLYTHLHIKEDAHSLYGFFNPLEKQLFIHLISVNGVGPNTARLILSSLEAQQIQQGIASGDDKLFARVKGIGPKTAQRIIIDLRDKIGKEFISNSETTVNQGFKPKNEAISALIALGFPKNTVDQLFSKNLELQDADAGVEDLIKIALKKLA